MIGIVETDADELPHRSNAWAKTHSAIDNREFGRVDTS
jgi:hypothetical protein